MPRVLSWLMIVVFAHPAWAAPQIGVEVTPLGGYGFGGAFEEKSTDNRLTFHESGLYGLVVDWDIDDETQYEFFFSRQETKLTSSKSNTPADSLFDLDVSYLHIGGTVGFGDRRIDRFILGTVGLTHFNPQLPGYGSKTRVSMSLGGGIKFFLTENFGVRFELRGIGTLIEGDLWFASDSSGTVIGVRGDVIVQGQANAGLILRF